MSIIVAVRKNGESVIGADALATFGDGDLKMSSEHLAAPSKLIGRDGTWIGYAGDSVCQGFLADHVHHKGLWSSPQGLLAFWLGFRRALRDRYTLIYEGGDHFAILNNEFVVVEPDGEITWIPCDFSIQRMTCDAALGSGYQYAYGALHVAYLIPGLDAEEICRRALQAACKFNAACGGEIEIKRAGEE